MKENNRDMTKRRHLEHRLEQRQRKIALNLYKKECYDEKKVAYIPAFKLAQMGKWEHSVVHKNTTCRR